MENANVENWKYNVSTKEKRQSRKKASLVGFDCACCRAYYENLNISSSDLVKRLQNCSRHRGKFPRSRTPENFWTIEFSDEKEDNVVYRPLMRKKMK